MNEAQILIRTAGTVLAGLVGVALGGVLNSSVDGWTARELIRTGRDVCRGCGRRREASPAAAGDRRFALRRRCVISDESGAMRYPLVVAGVAATWAVAGWQALPALYLPGWTAISIFDALVFAAVKMILCWLLIALAVMDAEHRWLPDWFTLGGAALGAVFSLGRFAVYSMWKGIPLHWSADTSYVSHRQHLYEAVLHWIFGILAVPGIVWLVRWIYERIRRQEGAKAGEAKLMLLLAAWLGLSHTLLAFVIGLLLAEIALLTIAVKKGRGIGLNAGLPVASFFCFGGIVSGLWGRQMIDAYLRWSDFL